MLLHRQMIDYYKKLERTNLKQTSLTEWGTTKDEAMRLSVVCDSSKMLIKLLLWSTTFKTIIRHMYNKVTFELSPGWNKWGQEMSLSKEHPRQRKIIKASGPEASLVWRFTIHNGIWKALISPSLRII